MALAKIYFSGKKYEYTFKKPSENTTSALAMAIATAMWEKQHKRKLTKFSGSPQHYNLLMELLSRKRDIYTNEGHIDYFQEATRRSNEEKHVFDEKTKKWRVLNWRVGKTFNDHVVIEIDNHDLNNLKTVSRFYEQVLHTTFRVIKSHKGFWLISENACQDKTDFVYQNCKILNPYLLRSDLEKFLIILKNADIDKNGAFLKASPDKIKSLSGVAVKGDIDILFTLLSIKREQSTLRISKKHSTDKLEQLII